MAEEPLDQGKQLQVFLDAIGMGNPWIAGLYAFGSLAGLAAAVISFW